MEADLIYKIIGLAVTGATALLAVLGTVVGLFVRWLVRAQGQHVDRLVGHLSEVKDSLDRRLDLNEEDHRRIQRQIEKHLENHHGLARQ